MMLAACFLLHLLVASPLVCSASDIPKTVTAQSSDEEPRSYERIARKASKNQVSLEAHGAALSALSNSVAAVSDTLTSLATLVNILNGKVESMEQRTEAFTTSGEVRLSALEANVSSFVSRSVQVAFTVQFSKDPAPPISTSNNEPCLFDNIISNIGGAYSPNTGVFTAPVDGLYAFFFKFMSTNNHGAASVGIVTSSGKLLGRVWGDGQSDINDQSSVLVTAQLKEGMTVWATWKSGNSVIRGGSWTVFSGFLL